jgi:hypothetical protein
MEEYTSPSSKVFHNIPGGEELIVLSRGAKMNNSIITLSNTNTMLMLSGLAELRNLVIVFPPKENS